MKIRSVLNIYSVIGTILIVNIGTLLALRFGDPQWDKIIYVSQAYYWPKYINGKIGFPDKFTGSWKQWHRNGILRSEEIFIEGVKHGTQKYWNEAGEIQEKHEFIFGKQDGLSIIDAKERGVLIYNYRGGNCFGKTTIWNQKGLRKNKGKYYLGNRHLIFRKWDDTVISDSCFQNGKLKGKTLFWNSFGKIKRIEIYNQGELVKTSFPIVSDFIIQ